MFYSAKIEESLNKCAEYTKQTNCEYAIALDRDGKVLMEKGGDRDQVHFEPKEVGIILNKAHDLVHSHPTCSPLSQADLMFATKMMVRVWVKLPCDSVMSSLGLKYNVALQYKYWYEMHMQRGRYLLDRSAMCLESTPIVGTKYSTFPLLNSWEHIELCRLVARRTTMMDYTFDLSDEFRHKCYMAHSIEQDFAKRNDKYQRLVDHVTAELISNNNLYWSDVDSLQSLTHNRG